MASGDDGVPNTPTSTPPRSVSSPPRSPKIKSVSGSIFKSMKTHLGVVKAAIGNNDGGGKLSPLLKAGDLYPWDGEPATPKTPKRRDSEGSNHSTNVDLSMTGGSFATQKTTQRKNGPARVEVEQPMSAAATTAAAALDAMKGMPAQPGSPQHLGQKQQRFYMAGDASSPGDMSQSSHSKHSITSVLPLRNTWSWSEKLFLSQDDEEVSMGDSFEVNRTPSPGVKQGASFPSIKPVSSVKFDPIIESAAAPDGDDDDATCNNTVVEKVRQRGKKASRASTVGAFVTFLKALFGIGMLSNPAVLGEVGLLLGTFCHLFIVVGCAFACYLLLAARQMAKMEVVEQQRRDQEKRDNYSMWRAEMESRAAQRAGRSQAVIEMKEYHRDISAMTQNTNTAILDGSDHPSERTLTAANTGSGTAGEEDWTVTPVPIPLTRVGTSIVHPKEGWGRCEDALQNVARRSGSPNSEEGSNTPFATPSCGNVQIMKQSKSLNNLESSKSVNRSSKPGAKAQVTDEYQRFTDKIHNEYMKPPPPEPPLPPPRPAQVRLITYGDVAKYLAGQRAAFFVVFTIVTVHLMFASGMVHLAVENLCYVVGWERLGWSYVEEYVEDERHAMMRRLSSSGDEDRNNASRSSDEEEYYLEWKGPDFVGRLAMASLLFPIIQGLLQIPTLKELVTISSLGLVTYAVGCIGSMLYTAIVLTEGHPFTDHPTDMWESKWSGIPTYVATTVYCIEGINLALPTVSSIEGAQRWGGPGLMRWESSQTLGGKRNSERKDLSVFIVVGAVFLYGMVTLVVSWIGLAGGLGGGTGTVHGEDGCWDVTYCLNSSAVRFVYMLSLGVALILTLPVILYPSTEMLEVWLDERNDERRRRMEAAATMSQQRDASRPFWRHQKSLVPDDETVYTVDMLSPRALGVQHKDIEMREMSSHSNPGGYVAPDENLSRSPDTLTTMFQNEDELNSPVAAGNPENTKLKAKRKLKYWKLRMFLAFVICVIGTLEGSFPSVLKAAEVIRGVGLSIAGFIFPPLLYMSAVGGNFSVPMASAMALLIGLGLFNIVLVLMSAFGSKDFIVEEGRGNFYEL